MFGGTSIKVSTGSKYYVNPFDFDLALLEDEGVDVIADKCQLIESFISVMNPNRPLTPQEVSFIGQKFQGNEIQDTSYLHICR